MSGDDVIVAVSLRYNGIGGSIFDEVCHLKYPEHVICVDKIKFICRFFFDGNGDKKIGVLSKPFRFDGYDVNFVADGIFAVKNDEVYRYSKERFVLMDEEYRAVWNEIVDDYVEERAKKLEKILDDNKCFGKFKEAAKVYNAYLVDYIKKENQAMLDKINENNVILEELSSWSYGVIPVIDKIMNYADTDVSDDDKAIFPIINNPSKD